MSIITIFLAGFAGYGIWQGRLNRSAEDYFLGARKIPWLVALFSIVATETSVLTFISVPGLAFRGDWYFLQLAFGYIFGRVLVSVFLLPPYFARGVTSIYEVLGHSFGPGIQKTASAVFLITRVLADGVRFLATAVIVQVVTGWPITAAVLVIGVVTLVYTLLGGIRTVVWVDSLQFLIYLAGALVSLFFLFQALDRPFTGLFQELLGSGKLRILHFEGSPLTNPWHGAPAFIGGMLLSFASHGADHMMAQRALVCRSLNTARVAMIGSGIFAFMQFSIFLLLGSLIFLLLGEAGIEKDREFSTFIVDHLPAGVRGLLLAGVLSAAMSTLSSSINSLASSTIMDWSRKKASLRRSRSVSLFWASVLIAIALLFDESDKAIVEVGLEIASFTYGGLLGLFLLSLSKRTFRSPSLIIGLVSSLAIVLALRSAGLAWTWFVGAGAAANLAITHSVESLWPCRNQT